MTHQETPTEELRVPTNEIRIPSGESGQRLARRKLMALDRAIREHQSQTSRAATAKRPSDHALYRARNEIQGGPT